MTVQLRRPGGWSMLWFVMAGCRSQAVEPVPPPATHELVVAPPGARGARAAGTEGAPAAPGAGELIEPGGSDEPPDPEPEVESDGGIAPDGGRPLDSPPGVTL